MLIEINGDALRLLERFVKYATTPSLSVDVSDALYCSHEELLRRKGYYHDLYSKQFAEESQAKILK